MTSLAAAAARYAARGWHVFPLVPRDKRPLTTRGHLDATTDLATVTAWWAGCPEANIGLAPGRSGLLVVDVDGPEGERTAGALGLFAEPTVEVTTGRPEGGRHLYFQRPDLPHIGNVDLGTGLDVRADGGYVLLPPSVHPSGRRYAWTVKVPPLPVPSRALAALRASATAPAARTGSAEPIPAGARNDTLARLAGAMRRRGACEAAIRAALEAENAERCAPPLDPSEVARIAASVSRYAPAPVEATATPAHLAGSWGGFR